MYGFPAMNLRSNLHWSMKFPLLKTLTISLSILGIKGIQVRHLEDRQEQQVFPVEVLLVLEEAICLPKHPKANGISK